MLSDGEDGGIGCRSPEGEVGGMALALGDRRDPSAGAADPWLLAGLLTSTAGRCLLLLGVLAGDDILSLMDYSILECYRQ